MKPAKASAQAPKAKKTVETAQKAPSKKLPLEESAPELILENLAATSKAVDSLSVTIEMLVQKIAGMATHIIAHEEILAELIADNGLNLARVNARIRLKIASGTEGSGNANYAIDAAAAIASPLPRG